MAIVDRRSGVVTAASPAASTDPNPDLGIKAPVRVATTGGNITLSGLQTIDGVALAATDRVLVKDQANAAQNGIYLAASAAWSYAIDFATADVAQGFLVTVAQGAVNAGALFELISAAPYTLGTTPLTFQSAAQPICLEAVFDGGGTPLTTQFQVQVEVPSRMTLKRWTLLADRVGSFSADVWRGPFAALPLSAGNSITGGNYPALANQQFAQSANLAGWQGGLNAGDILVFPILSVSLVQEVTLSIFGTRP